MEGFLGFWKLDLYTVLVLLAGLVGIVLGVLQLLWVRRWNLVPLIVGGGLLTFLLSILGAIAGMATVFETIAKVGTSNPALAAIGIRDGLSSALVIALLGTLLVFVQTFVGAIAVTVRAKLGNERSYPR